VAIKILLQTTIAAARDDWSIARFGVLANFLREQVDSAGRPEFAVTARDREAVKSNDPVLSTLQNSEAKSPARRGRARS
jgi:hypothetical protein